MATRNELILSGILGAVIVVAAVTVVLLMANYPVSSTGKIKAIGCQVWADANNTVVLQRVDWGVLSPGEVAAVTFWVQNTGNINGTLSFNVTGWQFTTVLPNSTVPANASSYLLYSWNYSGAVLKPFDVVPVQMQLAVAPNIQNINQFNCTINIWITEFK